MWLYKLTNKIDGKGYIGTSVNPVSHRVSRHVYAAKSGHNGMAITSAIRKYGIENFSIEVIGQASDYEELMKMEAIAIIAHNTAVPHGYNISAGGLGARRPCSPETRALISARTKGRIPWNFGKCNAKTIARYASRGNRVRQPDGRKPWNFGKKTGPMPEKHRQQIAETMRRVRATRFWSSGRKSQNLTLGGI